MLGALARARRDRRLATPPSFGVASGGSGGNVAGGGGGGTITKWLNVCYNSGTGSTNANVLDSSAARPFVERLGTNQIVQAKPAAAGWPAGITNVQAVERNSGGPIFFWASKGDLSTLPTNNARYIRYGFQNDAPNSEADTTQPAPSNNHPYETLNANAGGHPPDDASETHGPVMQFGWKNDGTFSFQLEAPTNNDANHPNKKFEPRVGGVSGGALIYVPKFVCVRMEYRYIRLSSTTYNFDCRVYLNSDNTLLIAETDWVCSLGTHFAGGGSAVGEKLNGMVIELEDTDPCQHRIGQNGGPTPATTFNQYHGFVAGFDNTSTTWPVGGWPYVVGEEL